MKLLTAADHQKIADALTEILRKAPYKKSSGIEQDVASVESQVLGHEQTDHERSALRKAFASTRKALYQTGQNGEKALLIAREDVSKLVSTRSFEEELSKAYRTNRPTTT